MTRGFPDFMRVTHRAHRTSKHEALSVNIDPQSSVELISIEGRGEMIYSTYRCDGEYSPNDITFYVTVEGEETPLLTIWPLWINQLYSDFSNIFQVLMWDRLNYRHIIACTLRVPFSRSLIIKASNKSENNSYKVSVEAYVYKVMM